MYEIYETISDGKAIEKTETNHENLERLLRAQTKSADYQSQHGRDRAHLYIHERGGKGTTTITQGKNNL